MNTETQKVDMPNLSDTQWKVIRYLSREINGLSRKMGGNGMAPMLSASRALVRRGFAYSYRTGEYGLTAEGKALIPEAMKRIPPKVARVGGDA